MKESAMKNEITLVIADDHPVFRAGLREIVEAADGIRVVAEAENGETALKLIKEHQPAIALLDIEMPVVDGFGVAKVIRNDCLPVEVIFLTMHKDEDLLDEAMELGAKGYLLKENAAQDILDCVRFVAAGEYYVSPHLSSYLVRRNLRSKSLLHKYPSLGLLTLTERKILHGIAENKTSRDIAATLFISSKTVENHRANIAKKLNLRGSHQLLKFALENKSLL
jgi:DNA-binding NarL/FixJ family response regulator